MGMAWASPPGLQVINATSDAIAGLGNGGPVRMTLASDARTARSGVHRVDGLDGQPLGIRSAYLASSLV